MTLPTAPAPTDSPEVFDTRAFAWVAALAQFEADVNATAFTTALPAQSGNSGKFPRTNGTATAWSHLRDMPTYAITDGASVVLNPANGGLQKWTLGAIRTATLDFEDGEVLTLHVLDGTGYTLTITGVTWIGGVAPTLSTTLRTVIQLWMVDGIVIGLHVGDA